MGYSGGYEATSLRTWELFRQIAVVKNDAPGFMRRLGVVLLAAGSSFRMQRPKLLLAWGGTSIAGHQIRIWNEFGVGQIAVVCAEGDRAMQSELDRIHCPPENRILNPAAHNGMFSSIRCAARWSGWKAGLTHWAITLGDQPHLRRETLQSLLMFAATHPDKICQPRLKDHFRHPVLMPKTVFVELGTTKATMLKEFLETMPGNVLGCEVDDPGLDQDIDTPADYEKALARFSIR
jgi:molybdenum cofactor cytidylyltransferase